MGKSSIVIFLLVTAITGAYVVVTDGLGLNYTAFLGWFSSYMAYQSYLQWYSMPTAALRQLQVPSMLCHPFFSVPALLTGHDIIATPRWAFVGCCAVAFLYVRSLAPGVGLPWPDLLVDWFRSVLYVLGVVALWPM